MTPYQWFNVVSSLGYVLFTAATSTVTMLVPTIILLRPLSPNLYARVTSNIFACWWTSCLFITERLNNVGVRVTGDPLPLHVPLLIMSNHKCNLDWMFLWSAAIRTGSLFHVGVFKAIAKSEIRVIPIFGWGCKLNGFAYVRRRWASDASHLTTWIRSQIRRELNANWTLIFPEGTRYTDRNKERSDQSCAKDGLEPMAGEILRPRTKGLALLLKESADGGDYYRNVVDMTIQYTDAKGVPLKGAALGTRCFGQLATGELPVATCHVHFDVFSVKDVPRGADEDEVETWVMQRWRNKAAMLEGCAKSGRFEGVKEWTSSGGEVPFVLQTFLRVFFVAQGLCCVGLAVSSPAFAAYVACAMGGLAVIAHTDPAWW